MPKPDLTIQALKTSDVVFYGAPLNPESQIALDFLKKEMAKNQAYGDKEAGLMMDQYVEEIAGYGSGYNNKSNSFLLPNDLDNTNKGILKNNISAFTSNLPQHYTAQWKQNFLKYIDGQDLTQTALVKTDLKKMIRGTNETVTDTASLTALEMSHNGKTHVFFPAIITTYNDCSLKEKISAGFLQFTPGDQDELLAAAIKANSVELTKDLLKAGLKMGKQAQEELRSNIANTPRYSDKSGYPKGSQFAIDHTKDFKSLDKLEYKQALAMPALSKSTSFASHGAKAEALLGSPTLMTGPTTETAIGRKGPENN